MISYCKSSAGEPFKNNVAHGFLPYKGESNFVIKNIMLRYTWSPIIFKACYRHESNFLSAEYIALDFDEGVTIKEIARKFCDSWHIIGTTKSHQKWKGERPPCDRFRLLLKATRATKNLREYKHTMKSYVMNHQADRKCFDGARYFFPCDKIVSEFFEEDCYYEEWKDPPSLEEEMKAERRREANIQNRIEHGIMPYFSRWCLTNEIPIGERSVSIWKMGKELYRCGLSYEEALSRILASPTYRDSVMDSNTLKKIKSQLKGGYDQMQKTWGP